jgi:hypothetical protein
MWILFADIVLLLLDGLRSSSPAARETDVSRTASNRTVTVSCASVAPVLTRSAARAAGTASRDDTRMATLFDAPPSWIVPVTRNVGT